MDVMDFCARYLGEELGMHSKSGTDNALEAEADIVACRYFPVANPAYIPHCGWGEDA
jgi:hypothetical protein